jgi:hypothetical protein
MTSEKYNGWANWETWNFNLHYDDAFSEDADDCFYGPFLQFEDVPFAEMTKDKLEAATHEATRDLADRISNFYDEISPKNLDGFFGDLVLNADINFYEIADAYIYDRKHAWLEEKAESEGLKVSA